MSAKDDDHDDQQRQQHQRQQPSKLQVEETLIPSYSLHTKDYGQTESNVWGPVILTRTKNCHEGFEVSVHTLPKTLYREFQQVFSADYVQQIKDTNGMNINKNESDAVTAAAATGCDDDATVVPEFLAIAINQHSRVDIVQTGDKVEEEKDRLLNLFFAFAKVFASKVQDFGYWCDYMDPCSGLPMLSSTNLSHSKVYSEVDSMSCCLGYKADIVAGFCKILVHPAWGSSVYPATIFVYAPRQIIIQILETYHLLEDRFE